MVEEAIEPELQIIDPHHHLWDLRPLLPAFPEPRHPFLRTIAETPYYTFDALHEDATSGHNIMATVYMECGAFYDASCSQERKPVGEVEFANGVAAQGASGLYGNWRPCAAIVGHADLSRGAAAGDVLDALIASSRRLAGTRHAAAWDADRNVLGPSFRAPEGLYRDHKFHEGFVELGKRGLTFDAWVLEPQLPDVIFLARSFPDQMIVLDHCGTPLNTASYRGKLPEHFDRWRSNIRDLAQCPNVHVKLGGLAMPFCGMPAEGLSQGGCGSSLLADDWRPYIETCIEAFGAERSMFESNYPVDLWGASYPVLWNAFKRLATGASAAEKRALFAGTAARVYGIEHVLSD